MKMKDMEEVALISLKETAKRFEYDLSLEISDDLELLNILDSVMIVDLLLETETRLENELGRYVPLADENTFNVEKSSLVSWGEWKKFLNNVIRDA